MNHTCGQSQMVASSHLTTICMTGGSHLPFTTSPRLKLPSSVPLDSGSLPCDICYWPPEVTHGKEDWSKLLCDKCTKTSFPKFPSYYSQDTKTKVSTRSNVLVSIDVRTTFTDKSYHWAFKKVTREIVKPKQTSHTRCHSQMVASSHLTRMCNGRNHREWIRVLRIRLLISKREVPERLKQIVVLRPQCRADWNRDTQPVILTHPATEWTGTTRSSLVDRES
jgi:hypothetical protein